MTQAVKRGGVFTDHFDPELIVNKKYKAEYYKPPTVEELSEFKDTETIFHSNLFRYQITELLKEIELSQSLINKINDFTETLTKAILATKAGKVRKLNCRKFLIKRGIQFPIPATCFTPNPEIKYQYIPPEKVELVGSFDCGTLLNSRSLMVVDLFVEIPDDFFASGDYRNTCYFYKRAMYLCELLLQLSSNRNFNFRFSTLGGDVRRPTLLVLPQANSRFAVQLLVCPSPTIFPQNKLFVKAKSITRSWVQSQNIAVPLAEDDSLVSPESNSNILADMRIYENSKFVRAKLNEVPNISDALKILKVWLKQRNLSEGYGSFSNFIASMFVIYLLDRKSITPHMSSYQVYRCILSIITKMFEFKISLNRHSSNLDVYSSMFPVTFLDNSDLCNLCASISAQTFQKLKYECSNTLRIIDSESSTCFEKCFLIPVNNHLYYDTVISIDLSDVKESVHVKVTDLVDNLGVYALSLRKAVEQLLLKALTHRVVLFVPVLLPVPRWEINDVVFESPKLSFGVLFSSSFQSLIDKGPAANAPEANEFREFWGDKSEIRRFADASILEAVYWGRESPEYIWLKIISYVLSRHLNIPSKSLFHMSNQFDALISCRALNATSKVFQPITDAYNSLCELLYSMENLPLRIKSISCISDSLRGTEVMPPIHSSTNPDRISRVSKCAIPQGLYPPEFQRSITIICHLELSYKWPDDPICVKRLKDAFYLKIVELGENIPDTHFKFGNGCCFIQHAGYIFRLIIAYYKEIELLKKGETRNEKIESLIASEAFILEKYTVLLPKLTSALMSLNFGHNAWSSGVRLCKRWLSSHLLLDHWNDIVVELICAYIFQHSSLYPVPSSHVVVFLRFLHLISTHDWHKIPLIVNFNDELKSDEIQSILQSFTDNRSLLPPVFIATPFDKDKSLWTIGHPSLPILKRTKLLAEETFILLCKLISSESLNEDRVKDIFIPCFKFCDVVIELDPLKCPRSDAFHKRSISEKNDKQKSLKNYEMPVFDFDPPRHLLKMLRENYDEFAVFFHDQYGGCKIGAVWKADAFKKIDFKSKLINARNFDSTNYMLVADPENIIEQWKVLGLGLITKIISKTNQWKL